jgi:carotenoid cleavage dioxygenase
MTDSSNRDLGLSRRSLLKGAGVSAVGAGLISMTGAPLFAQQVQQGAPMPGAVGGPPPGAGPGPRPAPTTPTDFTDTGNHFRTEVDLRDCEVEGKIPTDIAGVFYRVGPDPQYPFRFPENIAFDGEGHVSAFYFRDGHVDFKSRYARTQRYLAQEKAREALFGMYRNPYTVDPRAEGVSLGTANTQIVVHHGKLFALKEDSPPVAMDPLTLETTDNYYLFGGDYKAVAHTAHPKIDSETGHMIGYGYEAKGIGTPDIYVYECDLTGKIVWEAWVQAPYVAMIHDYAVTENHIAFYLCPLVTDDAQMRAGGVHFSYDSSLPTYVGVMRRGGDGSDMQWLQGPLGMATHTMGAFSDGDMFYYDQDMGEFNQFPFFPNKNGEPFDPAKAAGKITRIAIDTSRREPRMYDMTQHFPGFTGALPRQDDRYNTVPYRYGIMGSRNANGPAGSGWTIFDWQTETTKAYYPDEGTSLQEMSFIPRNANAAECDGYLVGINDRPREGRSDVLLVDTTDMNLVARVKLPYRIMGQVHGWWADSGLIPGWDAVV